MLIYVFSIIIVLGVLVFVHELGHFLAAKLFGVRVERFSIGFPPRLFGVKIGETDYCVSAIPLGGYVKMSGMIDESMDTSSLTGAPHEFMSKPLYQKVIIISAGVVMNFILAIVILGGMFWIQGEPIIPTTTIGYVGEGGIADSIGLQKYDTIIEIDGEPVHNWQDVRQGFITHLGQKTPFSVERNGRILEFVLDWDNLKIKDIERMNYAPLLPALVGELSPGFPAEEAGLQKGDRIIAINDSSIASWNDMTKIIYSNPGVPLNFTIVRGGETLHYEISPRSVYMEDESGTEQERGIIGIAYPRERREISFFPAIARGFNEAIMFAKLNITGFGRIISGKDSAQESLAGPIAIAKMAGDTARENFTNLIMLIGYLSIVLAIVNILPIPALDGGHLAIILIEGVRKKPLPVKAKMIIQQIGMGFLLLLIIFVFYNDIIRLIK